MVSAMSPGVMGKPRKNAAAGCAVLPSRRNCKNTIAPSLHLITMPSLSARNISPFLPLPVSVIAIAFNMPMFAPFIFVRAADMAQKRGFAVRRFVPVDCNQ